MPNINVDRELLKAVISSAQSGKFAAEALADWYDAQYKWNLTLMSDILALVSITDDNDFNDALTDFRNTYSDTPNIAIPVEDGEIVWTNLEFLIGAAREDPEAVRFYVGEDQYTPTDIINNAVESANAAHVNAELIRILMNQNLETASDRLTALYNALTLSFGSMSEKTAAYANAINNSLQTIGGATADAVNAIKTILGFDNEPAVTTAPDIDIASISGTSSWGAAVTHLQDVGQGILSGLKKVWNTVNGFFGGLVTKVTKVVVNTTQNVFGLRDAFGTNDNGEPYFFDYGRNWKMPVSEITQALGPDWLEHISPSKYYQFQLPAGYASIFYNPDDPDYLYCSLFTRPVNKQMFADFFGYTGNDKFGFARPNFSGFDLTNSKYQDVGTLVRYINPYACGATSWPSWNLPKCIGYFAVPTNNTMTFQDWIDRFNNVAKNSLTQVADWLDTDVDMWNCLRNANIINFIYILFMRKVMNDEGSEDYQEQHATLTSHVKWSDLSSDAILTGGYYDLTWTEEWFSFYAFNSDASALIHGYLHPISSSMTPGVAIVNRHIANLLCNNDSSDSTISTLHLNFLPGNNVILDALITPMLYLIYKPESFFDDSNFAPYINRTYYPDAKYYVKSDSILAHEMGYAFAGAAAVGAIVIAFIVAVKARRAARTIKASIGAMERQATAQLAILGQGWSASNWQLAKQAYVKINKWNKWAALLNSAANIIYGSLTAIPSYIAGKLSSALSNTTTNIASMITSGTSMDTPDIQGEGKVQFTLNKIYSAITGVNPNVEY